MRPPLPPGPYLVVGLARSGRAAAAMLREHGETIGCDTGSAEPVEGVETHAASDGTELLDRVATVVKSPGVPREAPVVAGALERGLEVHGELELAWRLLGNRFVAVTGTNGKTTTVSLLGAMYEAADEPVAVAGNVGTPLGSLVGEVGPAATVVCEASSFQLEDSSTFAPECAVLLNLEPDHLDRHGSFERYREAKLRAFANQGPDDLAVVPPGVGVPGRARRIGFADDIGPEDLRLRGEHNLENARAATAAAVGMGVDPEGVRVALREFAGVPHRLEEVGRVSGVRYVNDSKATNVASAVRGLTAFPGGVHAILGGSLKGGGFRGLREAAGRCRALYLIGQAEDELAADLEGAASLHRCGDLATAVDAAARAADPGDVVLLSPACASYDQYADYEERGAHFRRLVAQRG
ncbi:MAG: UDP-N-acetylmuramoyl-L-alanine--D-glutamate ligase [Actinomycetota bacterium]|nr:UDP-N-acetylmuramoyl-L-alanine--D-glutamate ligase [Actinomycetota bacterium]